MPTRIKRPTLKQKTAFKNMLEAVKTGKDVVLKDIMLKSGFSQNTAINPQLNLLSKDGFQSLLNKINDDEILNRFMDILRDEDKRASLQAGVEILKLKDRYPQRDKIAVSIFNKIDTLID